MERPLPARILRSAPQNDADLEIDRLFTLVEFSLREKRGHDVLDEFARRDRLSGERGHSVDFNRLIMRKDVVGAKGFEPLTPSV